MDTSLSNVRRPSVSPPVEGFGAGRRLGGASHEQAVSVLGRDADIVRVHTDSRAGEAAAVLGATAFSVGQRIFFGRSFQPSTSEGRRLLAHELMHVRQAAPGSAPTLYRQALVDPATPTGTGPAGGRLGLWGRDSTTRRLFLSLLPPARSFEEIASYVYGSHAPADELRVVNAGLADPVPPGHSVYLVDGSLSPAAKEEVERDAESGIMLRASGLVASPWEGSLVYRVAIGGADAELTEPQMAGLLAGMARKFGIDAERQRSKAERVRGARNDHDENSAGWVRWTSDQLGGVDLPDADFADEAIRTLTEARAAFDAAASAAIPQGQADLARGLQRFQEGVLLVDSVERTWRSYINGTIEGAGAAVEGLTFVRNTSFMVAAGLAGAVAAPAVFAMGTGVLGTGAVGSTLSAGAGLAAGAAAGGTMKGVLELTGATGGELLGMTAPGDQEFDTEYVRERTGEGVRSGAVEGLYGAVGSYVSAGLAARMSSGFQGTLGGRMVLGAGSGGIVGFGGAAARVATGQAEDPWWQELLFGTAGGAAFGAAFGALPIKGLYRVNGQPYTPPWMAASPFAPRSAGAAGETGAAGFEFRIVSGNSATGELTAIGRSAASGEMAVVRLNPAAGTGSATMVAGPRSGVTAPILNGRLQAPPPGLLSSGQVARSPVPPAPTSLLVPPSTSPGLAGPLPPASTSGPPQPPAPSWEQLVQQAETPTPRQQTGGFRSQLVRVGDREVIVLEGPIAEQIAQTESLAHYTATLQGEHAAHGISMQAGENLPEGITSAPRRLNLSELKRVENAIRQVADRAAEQGATVETTTTLLVEHRQVAGEDIPVLIGVTRKAWVRPAGSDAAWQFVDFEARIDPVTRDITVVREHVIRAQP